MAAMFESSNRQIHADWTKIGIKPLIGLIAHLTSILTNGSGQFLVRMQSESNLHVVANRIY